MVSVLDEGQVPGRTGTESRQPPIATAITAAYTVLVRKSLATRSTLAMTRRPSATTAGTRERAVEQDQPGHRPAGLAARAHGDAEVGVLQRQHVVDPVAGHRDHVPGRLQGPDRGLLLAGPTRPNTLARRSAAPRSSVMRGGVDGVGPAVPACRRARAIAPTVARRVAGKHPDRDILAAKY